MIYLLFMVVIVLVIIAMIIAFYLINNNRDWQRVAEFQKVSKTQFELDMTKNINNDENIVNKINSAYYSLCLPKRATTGSAGYDFFTPIDFTLNPNESIVIPTGIRVLMDEDYVLQLHTRSSLGFKFRLWLDNITGIIDSDYYYSDNEGHILLKLTNNSTNTIVNIKQGDKIAQGIFIKYGITINDNVTETRKGGFGSTGK